MAYHGPEQLDSFGLIGMIPEMLESVKKTEHLNFGSVQQARSLVEFSHRPCQIHPKKKLPTEQVGNFFFTDLSRPPTRLGAH